MLLGRDHNVHAPTKGGAQPPIAQLQRQSLVIIRSKLQEFVQKEDLQSCSMKYSMIRHLDSKTFLEVLDVDKRPENQVHDFNRCKRSDDSRPKKGLVDLRHSSWCCRPPPRSSVILARALPSKLKIQKVHRRRTSRAPHQQHTAHHHLPRLPTAPSTLPHLIPHHRHNGQARRSHGRGVRARTGGPP